MIIGAQALGHAPAEIAKTLNVPRTTVIYTLQKHPERNNEKSKSRSGRPGIFSDRDRRRTIKFARINPRITYTQLRTEVRMQCSRSTLYRTLKDYGLTNWLAKKRPLLRPRWQSGDWDGACFGVSGLLSNSKKLYGQTSVRWKRGQENSVNGCSDFRRKNGKKLWYNRTPKARRSRLWYGGLFGGEKG